MGFFSWLTADTGESIANIHSGHPNSGKTDYLLQPDGPPIAQTGYAGYGVFGGVDACAWLAERNGAGTRDAGIALASGCYRDVVTDELFSSGGAYPGSTPHGRFDEPFAAYGGRTPNDLIEAGRWEEYIPEPGFPLKFSFDSNADYHALPASRTCPHQGYFYPPSDDDEADGESGRNGPGQ